MTRTSTVVWSLVALVVAILAVLGAVYGPTLVREGRALVGPIVDIAKSEDRLLELNEELPFTEPADRRIPEDRFVVFLDIRRELRPHYLAWQHMERKLEQSGQEDWATAREVLSVIQTIMSIQLDTLRTRGMSPAEFVWMEDLVYIDWVPHVDDTMASTDTDEAVRAATVTTLDELTEAEREEGTSGASRRLRAFLEGRLEDLSEPSAPVVDGIPVETSEMLWRHRAEISELDLASYSELHSVIRGSSNVEITIDGSGAE